MLEVHRRPLPRNGTDHDSKALPSFPRFCLPARPPRADKKSIEVAVRRRKGSAALCSRCHLPSPGCDQFANRTLSSSPVEFSRLRSVDHAARQLSPLRHCGGRKSSLGRRQTHIDQSLHALLSPLGAATVMCGISSACIARDSPRNQLI